MADDPSSSADTSTFRVDLTVGGREIHAELTVPTRPVRPRELLPLLQALASGIVDLAEKASEDAGAPISCRKGCGACCRQLVPVSESEARGLRTLLDALPEPRRHEIQGRFLEAWQRLREAGLLEELSRRRTRTLQELQDLGTRYFRLGLACPFLEEESCSIHPDRPIRCREYLVTSPAEHCADPGPETIRKVPIPLEVWQAAARYDQLQGQPLPWLPLVLAPAWVDAHPEEAPPRPGNELLREFLERLLGKEQSPPDEQIL